MLFLVVARTSLLISQINPRTVSLSYDPNKNDGSPPRGIGIDIVDDRLGGAFARPSLCSRTRGPSRLLSLRLRATVSSCASRLHAALSHDGARVLGSGTGHRSRNRLGIQYSRCRD